MIGLMLLVPFFAALVAVTMLKDYKLISYISIAASLISLALFPFISLGTYKLSWFNADGVEISIVSTISQPNIILLILVLVIAPLIYTYSLSYFKNRNEVKRYYIEMLSFTIAMAAFAMAGNFIMLFIAWEFLSITSYLLIGFWYKKRSASFSARKVITIVFIGDISLLASIAMFWNSFGTFTFSTIVAQQSIPTLPVLLLLVAILTKSAQFPFEEWLPDAMEGPVPVSAYLHSATMVKAGVFASIILFPIFANSHTLIYLFAIGLLTAALATANALKEKHVKRVLAYSTVQELGLMLSAVGIGALGAAIYLFFAQAFYKVLLFFSSGVMINANENENIDSIYGLKRNKIIYISTLFGVLALAGFVPFDGFFSSVSIGDSFSTNLYTYIIISLITIGTSFFIFRWFFATSKETNNKDIIVSYLTQPKSMVYPNIILAALIFVASILFFYFKILGYALRFDLNEAAIETLLVLAGFTASYFVYVKKGVSTKLEALGRIAYNSIFMNTLYQWVAQFVYLAGEGLDIFDLYLNDLFDWVGHIIVKVGDYSREIINGDISFYMLIVLIGIIVVGCLVLFA